MTLSTKLFLCVLVLALFHLPVSAAKKGPGERASPVEVADAVEILLSPSVLVPGTVVSRFQAEVPSEVEGRLLWVAEVGQKVKHGEAIARLDDKLFQLQVLENEAAYQREKSRLEFLSNELKRLRELEQGAFASKSHIEKLQSDRDVAESEFALVKAKRDFARETLARYQVKAPFNGVVILKERRIGEWVRAGDTVVVFSNPASLEIEANVTEKTVSHIKPGAELEVLLPDLIRKAKISAIVPVGDRHSLLFDLRLKVEGAGWRAGQAVRVSVPTGQPRRVLAVPRDALVLRRTGNSVFVVTPDNMAKRVEVQTGIASGSMIEVIGVINPGDQVIVRGGERIRPGQPVQVYSQEKS